MKLAPYHFPFKGHILSILSPLPPAHHTATTGRSQMSPKSGLGIIIKYFEQISIKNGEHSNETTYTTTWDLLDSIYTEDFVKNKHLPVSLASQVDYEPACLKSTMARPSTWQSVQ